jgi:hypothetical protein
MWGQTAAEALFPNPTTLQVSGRGDAGWPGGGDVRGAALGLWRWERRTGQVEAGEKLAAADA